MGINERIPPSIVSTLVVSYPRCIPHFPALPKESTLNLAAADPAATTAAAGRPRQFLVVVLPSSSTNIE